MERELFTTDVESIEGIGAVGAVFEQVILGLCKFLARLILAEAVAPAADTCGLYGENQVLFVRAVEEGHEVLLTCENIIDEQVLCIINL